MRNVNLGNPFGCLAFAARSFGQEGSPCGTSGQVGAWSSGPFTDQGSMAVYGVLTERIITCGGQGYTVTLLLPRNVIPHLSRKANTIRACASPSLDQTARNKVRESDFSSASSVPKLSQAGTRLPKLRGFNIVAEA